MAAGDELKDPWGWLVAGVSGGLGWAVLAGALGPVAIPIGLGIGAAVLGTKVALGSRSGAGAPKRKPSKLPKPPQHSPQAALLARAGRAQRQIRTLADATDDDWLTGHIGRVDDEVLIVNDRLADLAGRVTVADGSLFSAQPDVLHAEYQRAAASVAAEADPALKAERQQTLTALESQVQSVDRLGRLRDTLLTRMQTAVVGLEGLASRMGELVALGDDPVTHDHSSEVLGQLTSDLDNLRSGLAEAEALSRQL